jgi:hypothetical protein
MIYRPREKKRHPVLTVLLSLLLVGMTAVLLLLLAIYAGYLHLETTTLTQRFGPTPTPTRPAVLYVGDGDQYFAQGKLPQAIEAYEQAIDIDPTDDVPYIRQSRLLVYTRVTARPLTAPPRRTAQSHQPGKSGLLLPGAGIGKRSTARPSRPAPAPSNWPPIREGHAFWPSSLPTRANGICGPRLGG